MTLGQIPAERDSFSSTVAFCEARLAPNSIYALLHRHCRQLFPDVMFADLFCGVGRACVPPMIVAVVMVLQRLEGLSDREAVDRFAFDVRWKYAAGGLDFDHPGFVHTVLVDFRARLAASAAPGRIFEVTVDIARQAGLVGRRRVLDSTPIYDAVATQDTLTLIRSAVRGLLRAADHRLRTRLRAAITSGDTYTDLAKPVIDWTDPAAREALVDSRARDAHAMVAVAAGQRVGEAVSQATLLLATVLGQDLDAGDDGVLRIARRVAPDRVISTVDPEARHGHKSSQRGFDGYKAHLAIDPDSEVITATEVSAASTGDGDLVAPLVGDLVTDAAGAGPAGEGPAVYGDSAYGAGAVLEHLDSVGIEARTKVQAPNAPAGKFTKDAFAIDLAAGQVTCPNAVTVPIRGLTHERHAGRADFATACASCPLRARCTDAKAGRTITIGLHEQRLAAARSRQNDPAWQTDYRATRPKVERKIAHLMRRRHGGRRARVRGRLRIAADFALLAAAVNLARLAVLTLTRTAEGTWATA